MREVDYHLRRYLMGQAATHGRFFTPEGLPICFSMELPWLGNRRQQSCIPAGRYPLRKRWSKKHGWHLHIQNVPGRGLILIHAANWPQQLLGCVAAGLVWQGHEGELLNSRNAVYLLYRQVSELLDTGSAVFLNITNPQ